MNKKTSVKDPVLSGFCYSAFTPWDRHTRSSRRKSLKKWKKHPLTPDCILNMRVLYWTKLKKENDDHEGTDTYPYTYSAGRHRL